MSVSLCFVKRSYFEDHPDLVKILDVNDSYKQSRRTHLCLMIERNENKFYIPLRNNLGDPIRKYGRIGHSVPSEKRPNAGLDYRYVLVINDDCYIEPVTDRRITKRQFKTIKDEYKKITNEFTVYLNGYTKAARKGRARIIPLYKESSLVNYHKELGINL